MILCLSLEVVFMVGIMHFSDISPVVTAVLIVLLAASAFCAAMMYERLKNRITKLEERGRGE